jgi:N-acetylmuramoyl-L-alanine amidase
MAKRNTTDKLIVHCTATPEGREVSLQEVDRWHRQAGYTGIGYHYLIHLDGRVEKGRDEDTIGAHTTGHNYSSIGICYVDGCDASGKLAPKDTRTPLQKQALISLLQGLKKRYPKAKIYGHRDFANKACPSFDAKTEYAGLKCAASMKSKQ